MGRRSAGETLARILLAFTRQPVWSQAALARRCDVSVRTLKARLLELQEAGLHLTSEHDSPHVYWTAPPRWFPGGRVVAGADARMITRLLRRMPESASTRHALRAIDPQQPGDERRNSPSAESLDVVLEQLEDAARDQYPLTVDYYTASRDAATRRSLSVHRIFHGAQVRVLATCHQSETLKFFRADRIRAIAPARSERYRQAHERELEAFVDSSVNWFHSGGRAVLCRFTVRAPESKWVASNLPWAPFVREPLPDGVRIELRTAGLIPLARFVVGLGAAACVETPELREAVATLAREALAATSKRPPNARSPSRKRSTK